MMPSDKTVPRRSAPWIVLAYFGLAPAVGGTVFFAIVSWGELSLPQWLEAAPPFIAVTYVVTAIPALLTAIVAAIRSNRLRWWERLGPPILCALLTGIAAVWLIVRLGDPPQGLVLQATIAASIAAGLAPGLLLEVVRR